MVKLIHIVIYRVDTTNPDKTTATRLTSVSDVSNFSFWSRSTIGEYLNFITKTLAERATALRQSVSVDDRIPAIVHMCAQTNGLTGCIVADKEYPQRFAYSLLADLLRLAKDSPATVSDESFMHDLITRNQTPSDKLSKVQDQLEEIKEVMVQNIEQVLKRGEKLDTLVEKSEELSASAVRFRKNVPKGSCCKVF